MYTEATLPNPWPMALANPLALAGSSARWAAGWSGVAPRGGPPPAIEGGSARRGAACSEAVGLGASLPTGVRLLPLAARDGVTSRHTPSHVVTRRYAMPYYFLFECHLVVPLRKRDATMTRL